MGYCCVAFSAPFAGAAVVSQRMAKDARYAKLYVFHMSCLSFHTEIFPSDDLSASATAFPVRLLTTTLVRCADDDTYENHGRDDPV